ncbi:MAG: response regulator [Oligoflexia bacterium]|nr:response regulator [Oligoflexia bacterium]
MLQLNDSRTNQFTLEMIEFFEGVGSSIGIAFFRKKMEEEKKQMQSQLLHSSKLAAMGTMVAGVAHEINNPLTIIMGNLGILEVLCENVCHKDAAQIRKQILGATKRISNIVNNLKVFSRQDANCLENIDAHKTIEETVNCVSRIYATTHITLETCLLANNFFIKAENEKIQQVLMNILSNAKDALIGSTQGCIKIITTNKDESLLIEIKDNGQGIPKEILPKIFDPFFTTKDPGSGTGLGLSICHSIINSFGGTISVESSLGDGSCFKIALPVLSNNNLLAITNKETYQKTGQLVLTGKVLIVDDEISIRHLLEMILSLIGLQVFEAQDGLEAYARIKEETFDFIITDMKMPKMNGDRLMEKVKNENLAPQSKFILITGCNSGDLSVDQNELLRKNATICLQKPFNMQEVLDVFKQLTIH